MPPIRVVVFDIGGVLEIGQDGNEPTASLASWLAPWDARLGVQAGETESRYRAAHADLVRRGKDGRIGTCTEPEWRSAIARTCGLDERALEDFMRDFWNSYLGILNAELATYIDALRSRVRIAMLSNSFIGAREQEEKRYAFSKLAELIVYSHEEGLAKPDARIYARTCERLRVKPDETIFIDDKDDYADGALKAGMRAIVHRTNLETMRQIDEALHS